MATPRDWLQLFRSHTSPLEMSICVSGSALACGGILNMNVLLFLIFGWLYHNAGYGHNSVEDYIQGFDRDDPHKSHHPLQIGSIHPKTARWVTLSLIILSFVYGAFISNFDPLALCILLTLTAMGFVYNIFGKRMGAKFLPIAIAHSLLFPFSYLGSGGAFDPALLLFTVVSLTFYLVMQIIYQIMIEGDLKDICMSEASLLGRLGVHVKGSKFKASIPARAMSALIKLISIAALISALIFQNARWWDFIPILIFAGLMLLIDLNLMKDREYDHGKCLRTMALMEVASTFALIAAIAPSIGGILPAFAIMVLMMLYFAAMNRLLWKTTLTPKV
ncbi:MAG: UbiA family prenyltransferase [Candidatus Thermoplasmatota archaeon]|nr:UbiA family prenyltransferase [Candidatus Thermoplasmatota archaeon]